MKLRTDNKTEWVDVVRGKDKARFLVDPLTPQQNDKIVKSEQKRGESIDNLHFLYRVRIRKIKATIKAWEGVEDENGTPLECNDINKDIVYQYNTEIIDEVMEKAELLGELQLEAKEGELQD